MTGCILTLLLMAVSGCAPRAEENDSASAEKGMTTVALREESELPTYERDSSEKEWKIPSETRFGEGDYGKKEDLSDVQP